MQNGRVGWYNTEYWKAAVDLTMLIVGQFCLVEFSLGLLETIGAVQSSQLKNEFVSVFFFSKMRLN